MQSRPLARVVFVCALILCFLLLMTATALAATFSGQAPLGVPASTSLSNVTVQVSAADPSTIVRATMLLDGVSKTPIVAYAGHWEWDEGSWSDYFVEDRTQATIIYRVPAQIGLGLHEVTVTVTNGQGITSATTWSFFVSSAETVFSAAYPAQAATVTTWRPTLGLSVYDPATLSDGPIVTIDGMSHTVPMLFGESRISYAEWEESQYNDLPGQQAQADFRIGFVTFTPAKLSDGPHTAIVRVANPTGRSSVYSWSFNVAAPPVISELKPSDISSVSTQQPTLTAKVEDNALLSVGSVRMFLDGAVVPAIYDPTTLSVSYVPPAPLANDQVHTVRIEATDAGGLSSSAESNFTVQIYADMSVSGTCESCHDATQHPMDDCNACHLPIPIGHGITQTGVSRCLTCHRISGHGPNVIIPGVTWGGGDEPQDGYTGYWGNYCTYCHSANYPTVPRHPSDVASFHNADSEMSACSPCHVTSLTREHNRYQASSGEPLGCDTCHGPTASAAVQSAISAGDTSCAACHPSADHESFHTVDVDADCAGCHAGTSLTSLHAAVGCAGCHQSTDSVVLTAIESGQKICSSCHVAQPHGGIEAAHAATQISGPVSVFSYSHWGVTPPIVRDVQCTLCHASMNLIAEHGGSCGSCHDGARPIDTFEVWGGGCQQGACHTTIDHGAGEEGHVSLDCESACHDSNDWSVPYSRCDACHNPSSQTPVTTCDARTAYVGSATITFSARGIAWTYYRIDDGAKVAGGDVSIPGPAVGSAEHTIEYWSVDDSGREELPHKTAHVTILADVMPPVTTSDARASYAGPATIMLSATDDNSYPIRGTFWSLDGSTPSAGTSVAVPQPTSGQQEHVLEFWSVDASGNEELPHKIAVFTVAADSTAPTGSVTIQQGQPYTMVRSVLVSFEATDADGSGGIQLRYSTDNVNWTAWQAFAPSRTVGLPTGEGPKTVWVQFKDAAGNVSTIYSDDIVYDATGPTGSIAIDSGAASTSSTTVSLSLAASDALSGVVSMRFSNDASAWTAWEPFAAFRQWSLVPGSGTRYTYVQFRDGAGNVRQSSDSITLVEPAASPPAGDPSVDGGSDSSQSVDP